MKGGRGSLLSVLPYALIAGALLVIPALGVLQLSFQDPATAGFTLANYARILDSYYLSIILRTVKLALLATMVELAIAFPLAYVLARAAPGPKRILTLCVMIPLMTSVVVKSLGWYILMTDDGLLSLVAQSLGVHDASLSGSTFAVVVALVEFGLPFMVLSLATAIEKIPRNLEEAALNLHASPVFVFWHVVLPLSRSGILSGFLLCFGVSASAYVIPAMLGGTKVKMAAQVVYEDVLVAFNWPGAAAVSMVLLIALSLILYISLLAGRTKNEARS